MTLRLAIIADDLTGALDAAAPFAGAPGVVVATRPEALGPALKGAEVVAVSTRSREVSEREAAARVRRVLDGLPPGVRVMKKVDSRLKGNIAAELDEFGGRLFVAPALPEFGRIVRDGCVAGFGVERPFSVADRLGRHAVRAMIPDVGTGEEMERALRAAPSDSVLVGARGLAVALARQFGLAAPPVEPWLPEPAAVVVGSTDPITLAQVAALRAARSDVRHVAAPSGEVPAPGRGPARITVIQAVPGPERAPVEVARRLAETVLPWLEPMRAILLTGGATAETVLDRLGTDRLTLVGEALPGMPIAVSNGRRLVTKSGGFGTEDCLVRLLAEDVEKEDMGS